MCWINTEKRITNLHHNGVKIPWICFWKKANGNSFSSVSMRQHKWCRFSHPGFAVLCQLLQLTSGKFIIHTQLYVLERHNDIIVWFQKVHTLKGDSYIFNFYAFLGIPLLFNLSFKSMFKVFTCTCECFARINSIILL